MFFVFYLHRKIVFHVQILFVFTFSISNGSTKQKFNSENLILRFFFFFVQAKFIYYLHYDVVSSGSMSSLFCCETNSAMKMSRILEKQDKSDQYFRASVRDKHENIRIV